MSRRRAVLFAPIITLRHKNLRANRVNGMASFIDMITAFIALLVSAAFLHFGADKDAITAQPVPAEQPANHSASPSSDQGDA